MNKKPIIIVAGEPNSVFLELFFKCFKGNRYKTPIIMIVSEKLLLSQMRKLNYNFNIKLIDKNIKNLNNLNNKYINIINKNYDFKKTFDLISSNSNGYIKSCFDTALEILANRSCKGLINGPISKKHFLQEKFLGITEYLANKTKVKDVAMLIYNKKLSVNPLTTHVPLKNVYKYISIKKIITNVKLINKFYKINFKRTPKIGITGLNPHCESNYKSSEEDKIITPAIKILLKNRYDVKGPIAADTIFMKEQSNKYDLIIGMYHDQVLTPMKTLFSFKAINITLGLPFIRISPDHGPNTVMLGKNK